MPDLPHATALKISRAMHHIDDLNGQVQSYFAERPMRLVLRFDPDEGQATIAVKTDKPVPEALSLVIGDAVHNLRAALDLTYFAILSRHTDRWDKLQFPFYRLGNNSRESVFASRLVELAGKEVAAAIEACEPYPNGKYQLHQLHMLDIEDKHRLLVATSRVAPLHGAVVNMIVPGAFGPNVRHGLFNFVGEGEDIFAIKIPVPHPFWRRGAFEEDVPGRADFRIIFGSGPISNREIIPALVKLAGNVKTACERIWAAANPQP